MTAPTLRPGPRPVLLGWWRRNGHRVLLSVVALVTALVLLSLAGAAVDDARIEADTGRATAEVLSASGLRTVVRFATPDGAVHTPQQGVAYPSGLQAGQLVRVEYAVADPEIVRVQGRSWVLGLLPANLVLVPLWLTAGPMAWWLRRRVTADR